MFFHITVAFSMMEDLWRHFNPVEDTCTATNEPTNTSRSDTATVEQSVGELPAETARAAGTADNGT